MSTTIRITYVRLAGRYRIDEVGGDGVVRAEISPAWLVDEAFAGHLAALVTGYRGLAVSHSAIDDDGVRERCHREREGGRRRRGPGPGGRRGVAAGRRVPGSIGGGS